LSETNFFAVERHDSCGVAGSDAQAKMSTVKIIRQKNMDQLLRIMIKAPIISTLNKSAKKKIPTANILL